MGGREGGRDRKNDLLKEWNFFFLYLSLILALPFSSSFPFSSTAKHGAVQLILMVILP